MKTQTEIAIEKEQQRNTARSIHQQVTAMQTENQSKEHLINVRGFVPLEPAQTETGTHSQEIVVDPKVFDQAHGLREIEPRRYDLELKYVERAERAEAHAERLAEALADVVYKLERVNLQNITGELTFAGQQVVNSAKEALAQWEQQ